MSGRATWRSERGEARPVKACGQGKTSSSATRPVHQAVKVHPLRRHVDSPLQSAHARGEDRPNYGHIVIRNQQLTDNELLISYRRNQRYLLK
jgi:hypothetical protein